MTALFLAFPSVIAPADNTFRCADAKMGHDLMSYAGLKSTYIEVDGGLHGLENMADKATDITFGWIAPLI